MGPGREREDVGALGVAGVPVRVHCLDEFRPAAAGPEDDADPAPGLQVELIVGQPGVLEGLRGGQDRQRDHPADPPELPGLHGTRQVDPADDPGDPAPQLRRVELLDPPDPALALPVGAAEGLAIMTIRADGPDPRDDHSARFHMSHATA